MPNAFNLTASRLEFKIFSFCIFLSFRTQSHLKIFTSLAALSLTLLVLFGRQDMTYIQPMFSGSRTQENLPEIRQVVFVKVHKAASSTVQNILLRFAMARNLNVLLPLRGPIISQSSLSIKRNRMVPHPEGLAKFDILCNHVVYSEEEIAKYFPDNAIRVAILREPMKQALSALVYYSTLYPSKALRDGVKKHHDDAINAFLRNPQDFVGKSSPLKSYVNNRMSLDLGFDRYNLNASKYNETKKEEFAKQIEEEFDFVLISDYFDESLILLRRYLRWPMKDIIYIKRNAARRLPASSPFSHKPNITSEVANTFREWASIDYSLYDYFLPRFLRIIKSEPKLEDEVGVFRQIRIRIENFCLNNKTNDTIQIEQSIWTQHFTVSKADCKYMMTNEIPLVQIARRKQMRRYTAYQLAHSKNKNTSIVIAPVQSRVPHPSKQLKVTTRLKG